MNGAPPDRPYVAPFSMRQGSPSPRWHVPPPAIDDRGPRPAAAAPYVQSQRPAPDIGIRVAINLEHQTTAPPPMVPHMVNIPRSTFRFDFDFEKKILGEAEKWDLKLNEDENWRDAVIESPSHKSSSTSTEDQVDDGGEKDGNEIMSLAVLNYGNDSEKIQTFLEGHSRLVEMGFASVLVTDALLMFGNDTDKASAYLLDNTS